MDTMIQKVNHLNVHSPIEEKPFVSWQVCNIIFFIFIRIEKPLASSNVQYNFFLNIWELEKPICKLASLFNIIFSSRI